MTPTPDNHDYSFVQKYTEGEWRVWLAARLDANDGRLNLVEEVQDSNTMAIDAIEKTCASNRWIGPSLKWLFTTAALQLLALTAWLLKTYVF